MPIRRRDPKPGEKIRAEHLKWIWDEMARLQVHVGTGSGLMASEGPNGVDLSLLKASLGVRVAKTTTAIGAAAGSTLGSGSIQLEVGSGADINDPSSGTPPTFPAYSNDDKTIDSGAYVVVLPFRDGYMIVHARCSDLGS